MRHAKRSSIAVEDVQLAARKNERTRQIIDAEAVRLKRLRKEAADARPGKRAAAGAD